MSRAQRRAKSREDAKRARILAVSAPSPKVGAQKGLVRNAVVTPEEAARRVYRTDVNPKRLPKKGRRVSEKRLKWREGRQ
jgi:hypothetical protein